MTFTPPDDPRSDAFLVEALNRGDATAFEALYFRYRDWVTRLAFRLTGNQDDAIDVLQETFTYFHTKFPGFVLRAKLTTFLYPVVRSLSSNARGKRRRFASDEEALEHAAAPAAAENASRADLARVVGVLPPAQRDVLLMRFVDDMRLEEIAVALDIPVGTVKSRLHNAIATLRGDARTRRYFQA